MTWKDSLRKAICRRCEHKRGDRGSLGNNTRLSRTVTSVTFRSCACFWTGSTNRCAPTASPAKPSCAPGITLDGRKV